MNITKKLENGVLTVAVEGRMDTTTTPQITQEIETDIDSADKLVFDMKDLAYTSSAGLRLLLSLHKKMSSKGGMTLVNVNDTNMDILELTGFGDILTIR